MTSPAFSEEWAQIEEVSNGTALIDYSSAPDCVKQHIILAGIRLLVALFTVIPKGCACFF